MTILTKPSNEKISEKVPLPLALGQDDVGILTGAGAASAGTRTLLQPSIHSGYSSDAESMVFNRPYNSCFKSVLLFFIAIIVMMMGILGGYTLYRMYAPTHATLHYRAICDIPYDTINTTMPRFYTRSDDFDWRSLLPRLTDSFNDDSIHDMVDDRFFREEIELDTTDEEGGYSKINVPDFKDGRRGRFMHDFKENQSAIIDTTANRCFIMPLDRDLTLPPKSFADLMMKMGKGYYNIDTERVRRNMRVVTPPITDLTLVSERIANECYDMKVYMLEKYISGVFKREAKMITESGKFAEFSGKGVVEFDILNIADIEEFENNLKK